MTEVKVKAGALAALVVSLAGTSLLGIVATDYVPMLPDALEAGVLSLLLSGSVWLAGWRARNVAGKLAPSTIEAAEAQVRSKLR